MTVICLSVCPPKVRGDLSRWFVEISTGVYVGNVTQRVREALWERICGSIGAGRATMVFRARNEQGMDFCIHNAEFEPIDFDGLKLILRPSAKRMAERSAGLPQRGFSNAAKRQTVRRTAANCLQKQPVECYVVVDIETTGVSPTADEIIEIAAIRAENGKESKRFQTLVACGLAIPLAVQKLTGITNEMMQADGIPLEQAMIELMRICGDAPVVSHNASFDYAFLRAACARCRLPALSNPCIDTLALARRKARDAKDYKLSTLAEHFGLNSEGAHRAMQDCELTMNLYEKLNKI